MEVFYKIMKNRLNVGCVLGVEDLQKFNDLMEKYKKGSLGRFYYADLLRECIRFTWENEKKIKQIQAENSKLNEIVTKQAEELLKQNNKIKEALKSLN